VFDIFLINLSSPLQARRNGVVLYCDILDPQDAFDLEQYKQDACLDDITAHANLMQFYTVPSSPTPSGRHSRNGAGGSGLLRALVDVDRRRIAHVLRNLVSNALNFTPSGGEVCVTLRLSRRMGPKSTPTHIGKGSIHRISSRGPDSIFGSLSTPNEDPATIENTLSNSERLTEGPSDLLSFENCAPQSGFMHKPGESPLPAPGRPVCFSRDSRSDSSAIHGESTVRSTRIDSVLCPLSEEDSSASHTPGNRRGSGGTATPHNSTRFEEGSGFFRTGWLRRKTRCEKSKQAPRYKKKSPSYIIVEVTDTGSGIAKENLDRVFKEIVQFNPNELHGGGHGGSGLGMVLSKGIVEAHGGKMWLTSEGLGKGCTFGFGLPISRVQTQTHPDHRGKSDTAMQSKGSVHGSCSEGGDSGTRLGNSIDVHARNFHSSVVAALSGLDSLPRPYGQISGLMSPARKCLRPSAFKPETSIGKIASFREPLFNEGDPKRSPFEIYPQETALNISTLSTTPDESRIAREETELTGGSITSRTLTPIDQSSEIFSRSISLITTADFIPEVQKVSSPSRIYNRDGPIHRRSQSADAMKPVQRPRSLSAVSPKHALIVEVRHC
jgi:signal transduction histidine kinase